MAKTRDRVLHLLLQRPRQTVKELAEALGINPISVRHHLSRLEAENLVTSEEERHGVGRPRRVYYLTPQGLERFPSRYIQFAVRLLKQLKRTLPREVVQRILAQMAREMAEAYETRVENLPTEERLDLLVRLLQREGFTVEWEQQGDRYILREVTCPYVQIGQEHPEVCVIDETLIANVLDVPAERVQCILDGDRTCTYVIPKPNLRKQE
ncbi:MAG: ArsR family transcriptional regulator [Chloroflexi bacterium]|nr:ArsR family transcriptional regulator [Chloroflexota bacterium]